jgi:hypothetical protein
MLGWGPGSGLADFVSGTGDKILVFLSPVRPPDADRHAGYSRRTSLLFKQPNSMVMQSATLGVSPRPLI